MRLLFPCLYILLTFTAHAQELPQPQELLSLDTHLETSLMRYCAQVGSIACRDEQGVQQGHIYYTYYRQENNPLRPITFVFNGGPGSSSIYLHLGAFGPKRLASASEGQTQLPPYRWIDNPDSILDLTDLVFIDPIGTGFSRAANPSAFYGLNEDIAAVGDFIADFVTREGRWNCAKYVAGESYGGIRAAGVSEYLLNKHDLYLNGLILISPALEYKTIEFEPDNEFPYYLFLPTYATTAWAYGRLQSASSLEEVAKQAREFALNRYAPTLFRLGRIPDSFYQEISTLTGLPYGTVEHVDGLIDADLFLMQFHAKQKQLLGRFDTRITGAFPLPRKTAGYQEDPSGTALYGRVASAMHTYLRDELGVQEEWPRYTSFNEKINLLWDFGRERPNILPRLRSALVQNPKMKLFAACGYFDLAVPFCTVEYSLSKLHLPHIDLTYGYYEGGHMFYSDPAVLHQFKQDLEAFYKSAYFP